MRIAILGTRGIPNRYGGFERFAEVISTYFVKSDHSVYVLSPSNKSGIALTTEGVNIVNIKIPVSIPSNIQTLIYDLKSLEWASKNNVDVVLECGYSYAIWLMFFSKSFRARLVTNPDGIEFKRKKWNLIAKYFLMICEIAAIKYSKVIICDSSALIGHYERKYKIVPRVIPYGAFPINYEPNSSLLLKYGITDDYFLLISRFTPENNIETILNAFAETGKPIVLVGDYSNDYGNNCYKKYRKFSNIKFLGGIYDQNELDALRYFAKAYIHGHSVGGTNPSLLEAMACKCFVVAHDNLYNREVLENRGLYFSSKFELLNILNVFEKMNDADLQNIKQQNFQRIVNDYSWVNASEKYLDVFSQLK